MKLKSFDVKAALMRFCPSRSTCDRFAPSALFTAGSLAVGESFAGMALTDADPIPTAIKAAKDDAVTVGGLVIGIVAALIVIGLIIQLLRKA